MAIINPTNKNTSGLPSWFVKPNTPTPTPTPTPTGGSGTPSNGMPSWWPNGGKPPVGDPPPLPEPDAPVFTSDFPELKNMTYKSQAEVDAAEAEVLAQREAAEKEKIRQERLAKLKDGQQKMAVDAYTDPNALVTNPDIQTTEVTPDTLIDPTTGQLGATQDVEAQRAQTAEAAAPGDVQAALADTALSQEATAAANADVNAATGELSQEAQLTAALKDPATLAQLGLTPAQIEQITQVMSPEAMQAQVQELVSGSAVDMAKANEIAQIQAAQADPSSKATVQGQLTELYASFDGANPPPWAAGAMRAATARLAARGLGASSMAGMAVVQAAMEAALPIASADAQTWAQFEGQNLSNRQQSVMASAQLRAQFLQQEFDQNFQTKVFNASRIAEVANMNFTAEQQVALENARLAQTANIANLNARQAKILADAAAMTNLDLANLTNEQQARVQNARSFLEIDLTNLNNEQQAEMFRSQAMQQAIFSDQAATNATAQLNATNETQTRQFMEGLRAQTAQFNASQKNLMEQFNTSEINTLAKFSAEQKNMRDQFNANNSLIIAQANTAWRQSVASTATAAQNEANMEAARTANAFTAKALDELWQRERDLMDYSFKASENEADRILQMTISDKTFNEYDKARKSEEKAALASTLVQLLF